MIKRKAEYDEDAWDAALHREHGDLLQSWRWGEFKRHHGWDVTRIRTEAVSGFAMAQVLFHRRGPFTMAYIPRGPIFSKDLADAAAFWEEIDRACTKRRVAFLLIEPDQPISAHWTSEGQGFSRGPQWFQTARTVKVPLTTDDMLLAQMRRDTRYNILYAQRHGVTVERVAASPSETETFYRLMQQTAERNQFGVHNLDYYADFLHVFGDQAALFFARAGGAVTAGLIAARCGPEGRSMYAGSSNGRRIRGDAALLRFEAMRWTRSLGGVRYDLGGIAPLPTKRSALDTRANTASDLAGVHQFKTGFGGEIVAYPQTIERRYRPALAWLVRRMDSRFREAPPLPESLDQ